MGEGGADADVRIRLVADENSAATTNKLLEDIRDHLKGGSEHLEQSKEHSEHLGAELLKANLYAEAITKSVGLAAEGFHQAYEFTEKFAEAAAEVADETNTQVRTTAGLLLMMDQGTHSFQALRGYARETREELEKVGVQAGVATNTLEEMYNRTIERGNRSAEQAKELVGDMALVGKIVPAGMEGLAQGMSMFELGMIRARNPIVQLIAATHTLKGNAHDAAAQLQKMTPAKQMAMAEEAIHRQAEALRKGGGLGPMTLGELKTSFGNFREMFLNAVGQPLLDHLIPPLDHMRQYLADHIEQITELGERLGQRLGGLVDDVAAAATGVYDAVTQNWQEMSGEFDELFGDWQAAWKEAFGTTTNIHDVFRQMTQEVMHGFATAAKYLKAAAEVAMDVMDVVNGKQAGTTQAELQKHAVEQKVDVLGGPSSRKEFEDALAKGMALAQQAGIDADEWAGRMREHRAAVESEAAALEDKVANQDTGYIGRYLDQAIAVGNDEAQKWAFHVLAQSDSMAKALMDGSIQVAGGFDAMKKVIEEESPELAAKLKDLVKKSQGITDVKGHGPSVNFYGASFHIKQDFRDQDPDRVLQVFKRDLRSAVTNRLQARGAVPFGL